MSKILDPFGRPKQARDKQEELKGCGWLNDCSPARVLVLGTWSGGVATGAPVTQPVLLLAHNLLLSTCPSHISYTCSSLSYKLLQHDHNLGTKNTSMPPFRIPSPYSSHNLKTPSPIAPHQTQLKLTNYHAHFLLYNFSAASHHKLPPPQEKILPLH